MGAISLEEEEETPGVQAQRKAMRGHSESGVCEPGSRLPPDTRLAWTLILSLAPRTKRNKILLFRPPSLSYFVIAAQAD